MVRPVAESNRAQFCCGRAWEGEDINEVTCTPATSPLAPFATTGPMIDEAAVTGRLLSLLVETLG